MPYYGHHPQVLIKEYLVEIFIGYILNTRIGKDEVVGVGKGVSTVLIRCLIAGHKIFAGPPEGPH